jgi:protein tyrosine phosphatase
MIFLDDVSRVHMKQIDDDDNSSYINASLVDVSSNFYFLFQFHPESSTII